MLNNGSSITTTTGDIIINAVDISLFATLSADTGDIILYTNNLNLSNTIESTGTLAIQPRSNSISIGIGTGASGTLHLDTAELANLVDGFASIIFGDVMNSGAVNVQTVTFNDPITIIGDSIILNGPITNTGNAITLNGPTTLSTDLTLNR